MSRKQSPGKEPGFNSTVVINQSYLDTSEDMIHVRIDQINSSLDYPYIETTIQNKTLEYTNELNQLKKQLRQYQEEEQKISMFIRDDVEIDDFAKRRESDSSQHLITDFSKRQ
jgi:hypothetical protein